MGPLLFFRGWALLLSTIRPLRGLGLVLLVSGHAAQAEVYRWVDANGRTHLDDRRPAKDIPSGVEAVKLRRGNMVDRFQIRPVESAPMPDVQTQPIVLTLPGPVKKATGVVASQAACAAKVQAFEAARACFDACGFANDGRYGSTRNNSNCGHCTDVPMPNC